MAATPRLNLIVMHGWGGSYLEAARRVTDLLQVEAWWHNGLFLVPRRQAGLLRHLLNEPADDRYVTALRKLIISRFLQAPTAAAAVAADQSAYSRFAEERLRHDFPRFGIPLGPATRWERARQLQTEAERELAPVIRVLQQLQQRVADDSESLTETYIRETLQQLAATAGAGDLVPLLENLREMHETGGDLDTVGSATLYAHWLRTQARAEGRPFRYGHEYRFVFVNYHESLMSLAAWAPADLYVADLPIGAFPELENDICGLHDKDVHTIRFEDHHPWTRDRKQALEKLVEDGKLGWLALSGPEQGVEQAEEELRCGADMVYANCVQPLSAADTAGARTLQTAAHGEDFVRGRTPLGILLTDLIKGGICKVELGQILLDALADDDAQARLEARGWADLPAQWQDDIAATAETLRENTYELTLADKKTTIISAMAVHPDPGKPKLPVGKAVEFFAGNYPDAHYIFYCWGASLMVARRLDHADTVLNLGELMPAIGHPSDGGHAGAAVCRPDANPRYPRRLLGRVNAAQFGRFNRYLADRLAEQNHPVATIKNISVPPPSLWSRGTKRLSIILIGAIALGWALVAWVPSYQLERVRASNTDFFPQLEEEAEPEPDERETIL